MTLSRTLALALATGALVAPTAENDDAPGLLEGIVVAAALAGVASAANLVRRRRAATV